MFGTMAEGCRFRMKSSILSIGWPERHGIIPTFFVSDGASCRTENALGFGPNGNQPYHGFSRFGDDDFLTRDCALHELR